MKKNVLSTIVHMLVVITSFIFNFLLFNIGDCPCIVRRYSVARLHVRILSFYYSYATQLSR
jgi:hypothetical protein